MTRPASNVNSRKGRASNRLADTGSKKRRLRGQSSTEYVLIVTVLALALTVGRLSPLELLFRGFADRYEKFTYSISRP